MDEKTYTFSYYTKETRIRGKMPPWYLWWKGPSFYSELIWVRHSIGGITQEESDLLINNNHAIMTLLLKLLPQTEHYAAQLEMQVRATKHYRLEQECGPYLTTPLPEVEQAIMRWKDKQTQEFDEKTD